MSSHSRQVPPALNAAAAKGDLSVLVAVLAMEANIDYNSRDECGLTPLWNALMNSRTDIVEHFLSCCPEVDANALNNLSQTPLINSILNNDEEMVRLIISHRPDTVHYMCPTGQPLLFYAVVANNAPIIKMLLDTNVLSTDDLGPDGNSALHLAIENGYDEAALAILSNEGVDPNVRNSNGHPALLLAILKGNDPIAKALIATDYIDVDRPGPNNYTPLMAAAYHGNSDLVRRLLGTLNVSTTRRCGLGRTALWYAVAKGDCLTISALARGRTDMSQIVDANGSSALHIAASYGQAEAVGYLFQFGEIDMNATNGRGQTAFSLAIMKQDRLVLEKFLTSPRMFPGHTNETKMAISSALRSGVEIEKILKDMRRMSSPESKSSSGKGMWKKWLDSVRDKRK